MALICCSVSQIPNAKVKIHRHPRTYRVWQRLRLLRSVHFLISRSLFDCFLKTHYCRIAAHIHVYLLNRNVSTAGYVIHNRKTHNIAKYITESKQLLWLFEIVKKTTSMRETNLKTFDAKHKNHSNYYHLRFAFNNIFMALTLISNWINRSEKEKKTFTYKRSGWNGNDGTTTTKGHTAQIKITTASDPLSLMMKLHQIVFFDSLRLLSFQLRSTNVILLLAGNWTIRAQNIDAEREMYILSIEN